MHVFEALIAAVGLSRISMKTWLQNFGLTELYVFEFYLSGRI